MEEGKDKEEEDGMKREVQARFVRAVSAAGVGGDVTGQHLVEARSGLGVTQQRLGSEDDQLGTQTGS